MILRKMIIKFCLISKMNKSNSVGAIDKTDLSEHRLDEISKIEIDFIEEINQR